MNGTRYETPEGYIVILDESDELVHFFDYIYEWNHATPGGMESSTSESRLLSREGFNAELIARDAVKIDTDAITRQALALGII